eukprot:5582935-Pyramimonas_sp.AAC.2
MSTSCFNKMAISEDRMANTDDPAIFPLGGYEWSTGGEYSHRGAVSGPRVGNIPIGGLCVVHGRRGCARRPGACSVGRNVASGAQSIFDIISTFARVI